MPTIPVVAGCPLPKLFPFIAFSLSRPNHQRWNAKRKKLSRNMWHVAWRGGGEEKMRKYLRKNCIIMSGMKKVWLCESTHFPNQQRRCAKWRLSRNMYALRTQFLHIWAPICMLGWCLVTKFLQHISGESLLQVRCWLGTFFPSVSTFSKLCSNWCSTWWGSTWPDGLTAKNKRNIFLCCHVMLMVMWHVKHL